jgi:hypothetical protein
MTQVHLVCDPEIRPDTVRIGDPEMLKDQLPLKRRIVITCNPDDAHIYRRQIEEADDMEIVE